MASLATEQERFDMGRVVSRTFGAISRNIGLFALLAMLLIFIPGIFSRAMVSANAAQAAVGAGPRFWMTLIGSSLLSVFLNYVMQAAVSHATVRDLGGDHPTFGESLKVGVRFAIPLFLLAIVGIIGVYGGLILLIVPGIILAIMWSVSVPAMVTERLGVFASLGRSRQLTKGSRWAIFGLLFVMVIIFVVPLALVPLLTGALDNPAAARANMVSPVGIVTVLFSTVATMLLSALVAAIYVELRTIRDGTSVESLAGIFA